MISCNSRSDLTQLCGLHLFLPKFPDHRGPLFDKFHTELQWLSENDSGFQAVWELSPCLGK